LANESRAAQDALAVVAALGGEHLVLTGMGSESAHAREMRQLGGPAFTSQQRAMTVVTSSAELRSLAAKTSIVYLLLPAREVSVWK
jgi:hypothetical protein